jgi:predicted SAM-dependent methyltransferase
VIKRETTEKPEFYMSWAVANEQKSLLTRSIVSVLPAHFVRQLAFELNMLFVRLRSCNVRRTFREKTDLLVNIGAGERGKDGWVNLDGFALRGINCRFDVRRSLPFRDNSVRGIFTEHFLEHLDYREEVPEFLTECYRVLGDRGVLRIVVPDAEKYLRAYVEDGWRELVALRRLDQNLNDYYYPFRYKTKMEVINVVFRQQQEHKFAYDFETLEFILKRSGFSNVMRQEFGVSVNPETCLDWDARAPESLYVDAIKNV